MESFGEKVEVCPLAFQVSAVDHSQTLDAKLEA